MFNLQNSVGSWPAYGPWLLVLSLIDLVLRGIALWRSARAGKNLWFIVLLVVNTLGLLPLLYILLDQKKKSVVPAKKTVRKAKK